MTARWSDVITVRARTATFGVNVRAVAPKPVVLPAGYSVAMPASHALAPSLEL